MFNEEAFKNIVMDAVEAVLKKQREQSDGYEGYADVNEFKKMTGISEWDCEQKVLNQLSFQHNIKRFEGSRKRYIDIAGAKKWLEENMKVGY